VIQELCSGYVFFGLRPTDHRRTACTLLWRGRRVRHRLRHREDQCAEQPGAGVWTSGDPVQHEEDEGPLQFGSEGWALAGGLLTAAEDIVRKRTPNSFHRTELHHLLQQRGVSRLVICGLQTEFCVDTTVRQALPLGYSVTLVADAHSITDGALRAEQVIEHHNRTLRWMTSYGPRMEVTPAAEVAFDV
jgi:nicotinamidase-related amidase